MSILNKSFPASHLRLSTGDPPRRPIDRETTPGRCRNLDYCSIGMQRVLIQVPLNEAFICPECAGHLSAPQSSVRLRSAVLPALRISVLLTGMALAFYAGYGMARVQPMVGHAVDQASRTVRQAAHTMMALPAPPALPPARVVVAAGRPYPIKTGPIDLISPPVHLLHEVRSGQVTIDCVLAGKAPQPACHVADVRGADAFSADAAAWLQNRAVRYVAPAHSGEPPPSDHRWRVVFQDFDGTQRRDAP